MKLKKTILILIIFLSPKIVLCQINDSLKKVMFAQLKKRMAEQKVYELKGKKLPDFNLTLLNGKKISSESLKGKPTIINFWFIECHHCIKEIPFLNKIKEKFSDEVNCISITFNDGEEVKGFLEDNKFDFNHIVNSKEYLSNLGILGYPKNMILDKDLTVIGIEDKNTSEIKIIEKLIELKKR